jgi:hypothetical protein
MAILLNLKRNSQPEFRFFDYQDLSLSGLGIVCGSWNDVFGCEKNNYSNNSTGNLKIQALIAIEINKK